MRVFFISLLLTFVTTTCYGQGIIDGFYTGKNHGSIVLGVGFEDSKKYLAGNSKLDLERSAYYASIFNRFGISENLDINLSIPFISSNKESNLQDIRVLLKYRFLRFNSSVGTFEISTAASLSTPISDYNIGGLNDIGQQATIIDTRAMVHFMSKSSWFATFQSGFSYKLDEVPNSVPATLKVGKATTKWYYDLYYDYQYSFGGIDYLGTPFPQNFREFGVDFQKMGGTLYRSFSKNVGVYLSLAYTFGGRNTFLGAAYGLGVSYKL